jgi:hypothetical protein
MGDEAWLKASSPLAKEVAGLVDGFIARAAKYGKARQARALIMAAIAAGDDALEHYGSDPAINGIYRVCLQGDHGDPRYEHFSGRVTAHQD